MQRVCNQNRSSTVRSLIPSSKCEMTGCDRFTQERKSHCSEHVLEIERPRDLRAKLDEAEAEVLRVGKKGPSAVDIDGLVVEEILAGIFSRGQVTWRRLCKDKVFFFNSNVVTQATTYHYLSRLRREGLIKVGATNRRREVVELTRKGLLTVQRNY